MVFPFPFRSLGSNRIIAAFMSQLFLGLLVVVLTLGYKSANAQSEKGYIIYNTLKVGFGLPYGGLGFNYEYGLHRFSFYASGGYRWSRGSVQIFNSDPNQGDSIIDVRIVSSFNYGGGFRFHFRLRDEFEVKYRVGVHTGWIGNYYDRRIGLSDYDQSVYGWALTLGADFLTEKLIFDADLVFVPAGDWIFNSHRHPYYNRSLLKISAGVGFDLGELLFSRKRKKFNIDYQ